jgi:hypothetical protein
MRTPAARSLERTVVLPFHFHVATSNVSRFRTETLSRATSFVHDVSFTPADISCEEDASALLTLEQAVQFRGDTPGIAVETSYPYSDQSLKAAALDYIKTCVEHRRKYAIAESALQKFSKTKKVLEQAIYEDAEAVWAEAAPIHDARAKLKAACENLDEDQINVRLHEMRALASGAEDATQRLATRLEKRGLIRFAAPVVCKPWTVADSMFGVVFQNREMASSFATKPAPESISLTVSKTLVAAPEKHRIGIFSAGDYAEITLAMRSSHVGELTSKVEFRFAKAKTILQRLADFDHEYWPSSDYEPECVLQARATIIKHNKQREMEAWIREHGSQRLKTGLAEGYSMLRAYREERTVAALKPFTEINGFHISFDLVNGASKRKASPTGEALNILVTIASMLNQRDQIQIVYVNNPDVVEGEAIELSDGALFDESPRTFVFRPGVNQRRSAGTKKRPKTQG